MKMTPIRHIIIPTCLALAMLLGSLLSASASETYPLRPFYPAVKHISSQALQDQYMNAVIVDVRSRFEFDVAHINKAILLPLDTSSFLIKLERLRSKTSKAPLVFYCNDPNCVRAYQAALIAMANGWKNVFCYDSGVFSWLNVAPERATLMGRTPANLERTIPWAMFEARLMEYSDFAKASGHRDAIVIDIRDIYNRTEVPKLAGIKNISLEALLQAITSRVWAEKKLLFFDADGIEIRWLHYFLKANGYIDYNFLDYGVGGLDSQDKRPVIQKETGVTLDQHHILEMSANKKLTAMDRDVFLYLTGKIRFHNFAMIKTGIETAGLKPARFLESMKRLSDTGHLLFSATNGSTLVQLNPALVWKGEMEGSVWKASVEAFKLTGVHHD